MSAGLRFPRIVSQRDNCRLEVGSVVWGPLAGFREFEAEGNVDFGSLGSLHQRDGVELPFSGFRAIAVIFIMAGVVRPDLADVTAGEIADPWEDKLPATRAVIVTVD